MGGRVSGGPQLRCIAWYSVESGLAVCAQYGMCRLLKATLPHRATWACDVWKVQTPGRARKADFGANVQMPVIRCRCSQVPRTAQCERCVCMLM